MDHAEIKVNNPLVSVVIPTRHRPNLVTRAVQSALSQTYPNLEVVVIIDGHDQETYELLGEMQDQRLRLKMLPVSTGGGAARNSGVRLASGEWIAFLDDDDLWLPDKLWRQMAAARDTAYLIPILGCRLLARSPQRDQVWPLQVYDGSRSMAQYLFCRPLGQVSGLVQTSSLIVKRSLLLELPFPEIKRHQDVDWIIEAVDARKVPFMMLRDVLMVWNIDQPWASISKTSAPQHSLDWVARKHSLIGDKATFCFVNTHVVPQYRLRTPWDFFHLLRFLLRYSSGAKYWLEFFILWFVSPTIRRRFQRIRPNNKSLPAV